MALGQRETCHYRRERNKESGTSFRFDSVRSGYASGLLISVMDSHKQKMSLGVNSDELLGARQGGVCGRRVACRETTRKARLGPVGWAGRPGLSCLYLVGRWELWNVFERTAKM